jgi:peptide/nickel transport system substrate-binding protein
MKGTNNDLIIIVSVSEPSVTGDYITLLQSAYRAIGINLIEKIDADYRTTMLSNDVEAATESTSASTVQLRPDSIVPVRNVAFWHSAYGKWYEDGKSESGGGIAPTGDILKLVEAYDRMKAASGANRDQVVADAVDEIYNLHKENVWIIGYLAALPSRNLIDKNLQNVTENLLMVDEFRFWGHERPEQLWFKK